MDLFKVRIFHRYLSLPEGFMSALCCDSFSQKITEKLVLDPCGIQPTCSFRAILPLISWKQYRKTPIKNPINIKGKVWHTVKNFATKFETKTKRKKGPQILVRAMLLEIHIF